MSISQSKYTVLYNLHQLYNNVNAFQRCKNQLNRSYIDVTTLPSNIEILRFSRHSNRDSSTLNIEHETLNQNTNQNIKISIIMQFIINIGFNARSRKQTNKQINKRC